jgi:hypothetical protein
MNKYTCKHHNGSFHNKTCDAGVNYADVTPQPTAPGRIFREPCVDWVERSKFSGAQLNQSQHEQCMMRGTCVRRELPTAEEIKAYEKKSDDFSNRIRKLTPLINQVKKDHRESWTGIVECPICKGELRLRLHVFGCCGNQKKHLHGSCQTDGCVRWAE